MSFLTFCTLILYAMYSIHLLYIHSFGTLLAAARRSRLGCAFLEIVLHTTYDTQMIHFVLMHTLVRRINGGPLAAMCRLRLGLDPRALYTMHYTMHVML